MKKIFLLFTLIPFLGFSQIQSGKILYKVSMDQTIVDSVLSTVEMPELKTYLKQAFEKNSKTVPYITYELDFNKNESLFYSHKSMGSDGGLDLEKTIKNIGPGKYYLNLKEGISLHEYEYVSTPFLVRFNYEDLDWKITQETKMINGYQCYKAVTQHTPDAGKEWKITAWFAPKLPFQFGPLVYGGLPGLVLELQQSYYTFTATQIDLSKKDKKIIRLKKGELVDLKDFPQKKRGAQVNYIRASTPY